MVHCPLVIVGGAYQGLLSMVHFPLAIVDTMDYIIHGPLSVGLTWWSIPWTIVHVPISIDHTRWSIAWTIVHSLLSVGHTRVQYQEL